MRLYEITRDNELLVILYQLNSAYHPLWLELDSLLNFYITSGDSVPQNLKNRVDEFEQNLLHLKKIPFDESDPDMAPLLEEIDIIITELRRHRAVLQF